MKKIILLVLLATSLFALDFDKVINEVKHHEGFSSKPYKDMGHMSVGYGTNLSYITRIEAHMLLVHRLGVRYGQLADISWFKKLSPKRQEVILNMSYQLGMPRLLKFKKMIAAIKRGHYITASSEMKRSKWYKQSGSRAKQLVKKMRRGW